MINWRNERIWWVTSRVFRKLNVYVLFPLGYTITFHVRKNKWIVGKRDNFKILDNKGNKNE
jgi:hypothetical protein